MTRRKNRISVLVGTGVLCGAMALHAADGGFKTTLSLGATLTDGNSETSQVNASLATERDTAAWITRAGLELNYGESTVDDAKETTAENGKAYGNFKKTISDMTFAYIDTSLLYDNVADIDYRATLGPGLGAYLLKSDTTKLFAEAGVSYVFEETGDGSDDYASVRFAERFEHQLSETAKLWQSLEYLPQIDDFGAYLINAELGVSAALNSKMNLRLVLQDRYDSEPSAGREKNDVTLMAGVGYEF